VLKVLTKQMKCDIIQLSDISVDDISSTDNVGGENAMNTYPALTETVFYILLSLSKPLHGYGIMQNIKTMTQGRINMGAGTLYGALSALVEKEYITEVKSKDPSKRLYVRTELGTEVVENEIKRLSELIENAKLYFKNGEVELCVTEEQCSNPLSIEKKKKLILT